jgi:hypothetical protein
MSESDKSLFSSKIHSFISSCSQLIGQQQKLNNGVSANSMTELSEVEKFNEDNSKKI